MQSKDKISNILYDDYLSDAAKDFLEAVKSTEYNLLDNPYVGLVNSSDYFQQLISNNTPELGNVESIALDEGNQTLPKEVNHLKEIYKKRLSSRSYQEEGLSFQDLSALLKTSYYNVSDNSIVDRNGKVKKLHPRRNIASGGGFYPVDVYVIALHVTNLKSGVYFYHVNNCSLDTIDTFDDSSEIHRAFFSQYRTDVEFQKAAGIIVFAGQIFRTAFKYRDRGILFNLIDTGALMHSFYMGAATLDIGVCGIGGYLEDHLYRILKLKSRQHIVLGTMTFGKI